MMNVLEDPIAAALIWAVTVLAALLIGRRSGYKRGAEARSNPNYPGFNPPPPPPASPRSIRPAPEPVPAWFKGYAVTFFDQAKTHMRAIAKAASTAEALDHIYWTMSALESVGASIELIRGRDMPAAPPEWRMPTYSVWEMHAEAERKARAEAEAEKKAKAELSDDHPDVVWPAQTFEAAVRRMLRENKHIVFALDGAIHKDDSITLSAKRELNVPISYATKLLKRMREAGEDV